MPSGLQAALIIRTNKIFFLSADLSRRAVEGLRAAPFSERSALKRYLRLLCTERRTSHESPIRATPRSTKPTGSVMAEEILVKA